MANLAPIINSAEQIGAAYAPSLNAAFRELHAIFGFWPIVRAPNGGARTKEECIALGTSWRVSDHYEEKGRAVDIDNHRRFRDRNEILFMATMVKHGWRNVQINGKPFPSEPWHFANHSTAPAGGGGTPITERRPNVTTLYNKINTPMVALAGDSAGTPANWLETADKDLIEDWIAQHGPFAVVSASTWDSFKANYLAALRIAGTTTGGASAEAVADELAERLQE